MSCKTHCCKRHGCKYGYGNCPVYAGTEKQEYPCEYCVNVPQAQAKIKELQAEISFIQELKAEGIDISYNEMTLDNNDYEY